MLHGLTLTFILYVFLHRLTSGTRADCQLITQMHKDILTTRYQTKDFKDKNCPTTISHCDCDWK